MCIYTLWINIYRRKKRFYKIGSLKKHSDGSRNLLFTIAIFVCKMCVFCIFVRICGFFAFCLEHSMLWTSIWRLKFNPSSDFVKNIYVKCGLLKLHSKKFLLVFFNDRHRKYLFPRRVVEFVEKKRSIVMFK